jgi:hypothetical protein
MSERTMILVAVSYGVGGILTHFNQVLFAIGGVALFGYLLLRPVLIRVSIKRTGK